MYAVLLVGGKGKRLRPLSTRSRPKAFLSVTRDGLTMFARTVGRARRFVPDGRIVAVANAAHLRLVRRDAPGLPRRNVLLEPVSRNTAPAIALAARDLVMRGGDPLLVVLPADQYIIDERSYVAAIRKGIAFVRRHRDALVVLGHAPSYAATGYGYVKTSGRAASGVRPVSAFTEKPDAKTARRYVADGRYLWNTGAFIFSARAILRELERHVPAIARALSGGAGPVTRARYARLPDISIDYAVMERSRSIYCVEGKYRWQDMGTFDALRAILVREGRSCRERGGRIVEIL